jgi:hypothetical protein
MMSVGQHSGVFLVSVWHMLPALTGCACVSLWCVGIGCWVGVVLPCCVLHVLELRRHIDRRGARRAPCSVQVVVAPGPAVNMSALIFRQGSTCVVVCGVFVSCLCF